MADTIFALASGSGRAGVAVIRVSGPASLDALRALLAGGSVPRYREAALRGLYDGDGQLVDESLVLAFEEGKSFTGEVSVELQCHGSPAVVAKLMDLLAALPDVRIAESGEFTRRALYNGRLDLTQVEALGELISAESEAQRKLAMSLYSGGLSEKLMAVREHLLTGVALLEATIDFSDEELPDGLLEQVASELELAEKEVKGLLKGASSAQRVAQGFEVALVGRPNVGKSSLLNWIVGDDAAIVTPVAGTTRDALECRVLLGDQLVTFVDTAGLRDSEDAIEKEGMRRAVERGKRADVCLVLNDGTGMPDGLDADLDFVEVQSKTDLRPGIVGISVVDGTGVSELLASVTDRLNARARGASLVASKRQEEGLRGCAEALERGLMGLRNGLATELVAEDVREGIRAVEQTLGKIGVEDVLGKVFSSFCIGK
ncbi:MAG: tRNA uridine-5-carboxymethylaminomethyl(34) synthesis GTPase MnmE [Pseudomonadota bacterium]